MGDTAPCYKTDVSTGVLRLKPHARAFDEVDIMSRHAEQGRVVEGKLVSIDDDDMTEPSAPAHLKPRPTREQMGCELFCANYICWWGVRPEWGSSQWL